ncbi:lysine--tRNA ligase [Candidatus Micrarchaeota archaeon]|nr:lysine--tRNA ligase [Candidatus Micrarchaeota archaeon]
MEKEPRHWVETLSDRIIAEKEEPYIITSGITTSGSLHVGTLCEFLFSSAIEKYLRSKGYRTDFHFIADIFDAFDAVPVNLMKYEKELTPHLGKPLCDVPDPVGCHSSYGEHFFSEAIDVMEMLEVHPKLERANVLYSEGKFDSITRFFLKNHEGAKKVVSESSLKQELPSEWNALMPVCQNCGRIATTLVTEFDESSYSYKDVKDVKYTKGCGYEGENKLSDHHYKLTWRLHWPSWMEVFRTSVEGAGVDHHTRGGSWDTVLAVYKQLFQKEPPIGYKFGFILLKGKKYSKSKGIGLGVTDILQLIPPELIKYSIFRPDIQENKDIDPTGYNLMRLFDDYAHASTVDLSSRELSRADRKKGIAFSLSADRMRWKASFADILMYKQLYGDWNKVGETLHDPEGVMYLKPYVEKWIAEEFAPEEYSFSFQPTKQADMELLKGFAGRLKDGMNAIEIHNLVFEFARDNNMKPEELFTQLYKSLLNKEKGPRMGKLIEAVGVSKVRETLQGM